MAFIIYDNRLSNQGVDLFKNKTSLSLNNKDFK